MRLLLLPCTLNLIDMLKTPIRKKRCNDLFILIFSFLPVFCNDLDSKKCNNLLTNSNWSQKCKEERYYFFVTSYSLSPEKISKEWSQVRLMNQICTFYKRTDVPWYIYENLIINAKIEYSKKELILHRFSKIPWLILVNRRKWLLYCYTWDVGVSIAVKLMLIPKNLMTS